jgi:hypothetical protein
VGVCTARLAGKPGGGVRQVSVTVRRIVFLFFRVTWKIQLNILLFDKKQINYPNGYI